MKIFHVENVENVEVEVDVEVDVEKDYEHAGTRADACWSCRFGRRDTAVGKKNG